MSISISRDDKTLKEAYDKMTIAVQDVNDKIEKHEKKTADKITLLVFSGSKFFQKWKFVLITTSNLYNFVYNALTHSDFKFASKKIPEQLKKIYVDNDIEVNKALFGEGNYCEYLHSHFSKSKDRFPLGWPVNKCTTQHETYGVADNCSHPIIEKVDERGFRVFEKLKLDSYSVVQQRYKNIVSKRPFLFRYLPSNLRINCTLFLVGIIQFMRAAPKFLSKIPGALWNKFMMKLRVWFNK